MIHYSKFTTSCKLEAASALAVAEVMPRMPTAAAVVKGVQKGSTNWQIDPKLFLIIPLILDHDYSNYSYLFL